MGADLHGIVNLDKPLLMTSSRAVERVRWVFGHPKTGHAGSLDPLATGVLVICLGRATKLVERVMDQPKIYRTTAALDITSTSYDLECESTPVAVADPPNVARVRGVLTEFEGDVLQAPPATSAIKIAGRPAYRLARAGRPPELAPRRVQVYWIHLRRYEWPAIEFEVACGRGTYIRALIRDIGVRLGTGGCLTSLRRLAVGPFDASNSAPLDQLEVAQDPTPAILPLEQARTLLESQIEPPRPD